MSTIIRTFAMDFPNRASPEGGAIEYTVGGYFVHALGGEPTSEDLIAYLDPPMPITPVLYAMGQIKLTGDLTDVAEVSVSAKLAGAFMFDAGEFWVFLAEEQPDTNYLALAYDGGSVRAFIQDDEKFVDYFIIRTTDFAGVPTNPPALNFEVRRVS